MENTTVRVRLKKNHNGCLYIFCNNNIRFESASNFSVSAHPYNATYSRDCGPQYVKIATLKFQVETLINLIFLCRNNKLSIEMNAEPGHSIFDSGEDNELEVRLALTETETKVLFDEIETELEKIEKKIYEKTQ